MDGAMNYEDIALKVYWVMEHGESSSKIIERACLEAQLEVLKELNPHDMWQKVDSCRIERFISEIESKLKAMK